MASNFTKPFLQRYWRRHVTVLHRDKNRLDQQVSSVAVRTAMDMIELVQNELLLASIEHDSVFYNQMGKLLNLLNVGDRKDITSAFQQALNLAAPEQIPLLMSLNTFWNGVNGRNPQAGITLSKMLAELHPNNATSRLRSRQSNVQNIATLGRLNHYPE